MTNISEFTEEDTRQIVSKFLKESGIDDSELSYEEKTIKLKVFRNVELKIGKKNRKNAYGKIDILIKNDKPFIILEIKKPDVSDEEFQKGKDQVLAYARLLLAPLAIITNLKQMKLFDPFTQNGEQIKQYNESKYYKTNFNLDISDDLKSLALQHFISYNSENLKLFCNAQREHRMYSLIGTKSNTEKKYIEEIYIPHKNLEEKFEEYLASETTVFVIDGESGTGKTNAICYMAQKLGNKYPSLFYSASLINKPLREEISQDFNYHFSRQQNPESILKRIDQILTAQNISLIIYIDAVDEYQIEKNNVEITEFYNEIKLLQRIKLCLNIKTINVDRFLYINDLPTLADSHHRYTCSLVDSENFDLMLNKYESFFKTKGKISEEIKNLCKLPFFMRIVFETYAGTEIPENIIPEDLIKKYVEKKLRKIPMEYCNTIHVILEKIAALLYEKNTLSIQISEIYEKICNLPQPLNYLLEYYLLVKICNTDVTFYYDRIRDYYIIFYVKKWNQMQMDAFKKELDDAFSNIVGQSALTWYIEIASKEHQKIMDEFIEIRALKFIKELNLRLDKYFKKIKKIFLCSFMTKENAQFFEDFENIGLVLIKNKRTGYVGYTYRAIKPSENLITIENYDDQASVLKKYHSIHMGNEFSVLKNEYWVTSAILMTLRNIFKHRLLIEGPFIITERLAYLIHKYGKKLCYDNFDHLEINDWFCNIVLPLDIDNFKKNNIQHLLLYRQFEKNMLDTYTKTSRTVNDVIITETSLPFGHETSLSKLVKQEIKENFILDDTKIQQLLDLGEYDIVHLIDQYTQYFPKIQKPKLFCNYIKVQSINFQQELTDNNLEELQLYLKEFFSTYISELRIMGEKNFPYFEDMINSYKTKLYLAICININPDGHFKSLTYAITKNTYTNEDEFEIRTSNQSNDNFINEIELVINTKFGNLKIDSLKTCGIMTLIGKK